MTEACPRCGDQTLWSHNQGKAWCRLCGHTWAYQRADSLLSVAVAPVRSDATSIGDAEGVGPLFRCDDPEGQWIKDQQEGAKS